MCARGACGSVRKGDGERDGRERGKRLETSFGVANHQTFPFFLLGSCLILSRWRGVCSLLDYLLSASLISKTSFVKRVLSGRSAIRFNVSSRTFFFPTFFSSIPSIITPSHHSPHVPLLISPHDRHYFPCPTCCYLPYKFLLPILVLPDYYFFFRSVLFY